MINVALDIDFSTSPIHNNTGGKLDFHSRRPEKAISKFAGEFKTRAMSETTFFFFIYCQTLFRVLSAGVINTSSRAKTIEIKLKFFIKNEQKFPNNYSI